MSVGNVHAGRLYLIHAISIRLILVFLCTLIHSRDRKRSRRNDSHVEGSEGNVPVASGDERRREKDRSKDKSKDRRERRDRYKDK